VNKRSFFYRSLFLSVFITGLFLLVGFRLFSLQVINNHFYLEKVAQRLRIEEIPAPRGEIVDREGNVLARDVETVSLYAYPKIIKDPEQTARALSQILKIPYTEVYQKLNSELSSVLIVKKAPATVCEQLDRIKLQGIGLVREYARFYPQAPNGSNLLGFVGTDHRGLEGLEFAFNKLLSGKAGYRISEKDALGQEIPTTIREIPPVPGKNLTITIDSTIQFFAERRLQEAIARTNAKRGVVIVNNPQTGEILAMCSYPGYDNNHFADYPRENWKNLATALLFEPGSIVKPLIMALALEEGVVDSEEEFYCNGSIKVGGHRIRDIKSHGKEKLEDIIINSCNTGIITIAMRLNPEKIYAYLKELGLGQKTALNLPGEETGILRPPKQWSGLSPAAISIGQEIMTTPLQMLVALSVIANQGVFVPPRIIKDSDSLSSLSENGTLANKRVISKQAAQKVLSMMEKVVQKGTGIKASLPGLRIAGKTGTGQKVNPDGRYANNKFVSSFVGFFPLPRPSFGIIVVLDEPQGEYYGGDTAAPVFKNIAQDIAVYSNIMPEDAEVKTM
jgi:cell division protein FtsI/penicillin-binding protein 2